VEVGGWGDKGAGMREAKERSVREKGKVVERTLAIRHHTLTDHSHLFDIILDIF